MDDCVFCAIAGGHIPADVLLDEGNVLAFRDLQPKAAVHILLIPREHYSNAAQASEADPSIVSELILAAHAVARGEGVEQGYRLIFNTGVGGGQTVFHAHLHLLAGPALPGF